jgi:rubrerythrin
MIELIQEENMKKYSISEIIEQAVQTERLGYDFYSGMLKKFEKDAKLQELFSMLAVKEQQHEKRFSRLKDKVSDRTIDDAEEVSAYLRAIVESEFFLGKNKSLPSLEHIRSAADAARFALGFEKETLLYFYSLKELVEEKDLVDEIIEEEKSHVRWLNEYMKSL